MAAREPDGRVGAGVNEVEGGEPGHPPAAAPLQVLGHLLGRPAGEPGRRQPVFKLVDPGAVDDLVERAARPQDAGRPGRRRDQRQAVVVEVHFSARLPPPWPRIKKIIVTRFKFSMSGCGAASKRFYQVSPRLTTAELRARRLGGAVDPHRQFAALSLSAVTNQDIRRTASAECACDCDPSKPKVGPTIPSILG
jgi:hypothetical protein